MAGTFTFIGSLGGGGGGGGSAYWGDAVANAAALPAGVVIGEVRLTLDTNHLYEWNGTVWTDIFIGFAGDVFGPASATDNALARFDGATGKLVQSSGAILSDTDVLTLPSLTASRAVISNGSQQLAVSATTSTELGYVSGVTSAIQTQLNAKVDEVASTDNAVVRFDGTGGAVQNSAVLIDDSNNINTPASGLFGAVGTPVASAALELRTTTGALLLTRLTTAQIAALTAVNGMIVYNTTLDRFQGYFAGAWGDLHGWGN
jgi:hypothetical protein